MVPISTTLLLSACGARAENRCVFHDIFPDYLFFECPSVGDYFSYLWQEQVWLWALWFISQIWITGHSTTTWTKFNTTFTPTPYCVEKPGHCTYYLPFATWPHRGLSFDPLTPSSCPRSYWMPPYSPHLVSQNSSFSLHRTNLWHPYVLFACNWSVNRVQ